MNSLCKDCKFFLLTRNDDTKVYDVPTCTNFILFKFCRDNGIIVDSVFSGESVCLCFEDKHLIDFVVDNSESELPFPIQEDLDF